MILSARWSLYWHTRGPANNPPGPIQFVYGKFSDHSPASSQGALRAALVESIERHRKFGIRTAIIGQVPELGLDTPSCLVRPALGKGADSCRGFTREQALAWQEPVDEILLSLDRQFGLDVDVILPSRTMCASGRYCTLTQGETLLYRDSQHLSTAGAVLRAPRDLMPSLLQSLAGLAETKRDNVP